MNTKAAAALTSTEAAVLAAKPGTPECREAILNLYAARADARKAPISRCPYCESRYVPCDCGTDN